MPHQAAEEDVISRLELVLPKNVLHTCVSLQKGFAAEFLSTNFKKCTTSRIKVSKQIDDSIRLIVSVSRMKKENSDRPEHILIHGLKENIQEVLQENSTENKATFSESPQSVTNNESANGERYTIASHNTVNGEGIHPCSNDVQNTEREKDEPYSKQDDERGSKQVTSQGLSPESVHQSEQAGNQIRNNDKMTPLATCVINDLDLSTLHSSVGEVGKMVDDYTATGMLDKWALKTDHAQEKSQNMEVNESTEDVISGDKVAIDQSKVTEDKDNLKRESRTQTRLRPRGRIIPSNADYCGGENDGNNTEKHDDYVPEESLMGKQRLLQTRQNKSNKKNTKWAQNPDRSHMKRPHYKREQNVQCKFCPVKLKDNDSLFDHARLKHSHMKGYAEFIKELRELLKVTCQVCQRVYSRKEQLSLHMSLVHSPVSSANCSKCGVRVKSMRHLKDHMRRIHDNSESFHLCHLCPASFKVRSYLSAHVKYVHTSNTEDAFPCDECEKTYNSEKYLRNHKMRVHGSKRHACGFCGKAFTTLPNMRRHMLLLHEKKGDKPFQCEICGRRFTLKANWKDHVNTLHLNSFSIRCSLCDLGFRRKKDLQTHLAHAHRGIERVATTNLKQITAKNNQCPTSFSVPTCPDPTTVSDPDLSTGAGTSVQYIMATPEILQAFGIQLGPENVVDGTGTESKIQLTTEASVEECEIGTTEEIQIPINTEGSIGETLAKSGTHGIFNRNTLMAESGVVCDSVSKTMALDEMESSNKADMMVAVTDLEIP